jgi:hypothetical protein
MKVQHTVQMMATLRFDAIVIRSFPHILSYNIIWSYLILSHAFFLLLTLYVKSYGLSLDVHGGRIDPSSSRYDIATCNMVVVLAKAIDCQTFWLLDNIVGDMQRKFDGKASDEKVNEITDILTSREYIASAASSEDPVENVANATKSSSEKSKIQNNVANSLAQMSLNDLQFSSAKALLELD